VGAGVSGLTTALCLARAGQTVQVLSDRPPWHTTSAMAGALWGPFAVSDPRVLRWSMQSLRELRRLSAEADSGVGMMHGLEAAATEVTPPAWVVQMGDYALADPGGLPDGYVSGWHYSAPAVEMHLYIRYLVARLNELGVSIDVGPPVANLDDLHTLADIVVNCTGLAARELVADRELFAVQGQLVVVENPGVRGFFTDYPESRAPTYFIAHDDHVVLGGSVVPNSERLEPDPAVSREIIARCAAVEPALATARIQEHRAGLRPSRPTVRLEREVRGPLTVIHNYGHGGSGLTLSWGCALDVRALIEAPEVG
jgi:D-amino-acid oxidase